MPREQHTANGADPAGDDYPAPPPQPKPPSYPPESWTLTASITSVTPHPCWRSDLTGLTYDFALIVRRGDSQRGEGW